MGPLSNYWCFFYFELKCRFGKLNKHSLNFDSVQWCNHMLPVCRSMFNQDAAAALLSVLRTSDWLQLQLWFSRLAFWLQVFSRITKRQIKAELTVITNAEVIVVLMPDTFSFIFLLFFQKRLASNQGFGDWHECTLKNAVKSSEGVAGAASQEHSGVHHQNLQPF